MGVFLGGCANISKDPAPPPAPAPVAVSKPPGFVLSKPASGKALIYFYREKDDLGADRSPKISLGDGNLFEAKSQQYKKMDLAPGEYEIQVTGYDLGNSALKTKFEPGKTYFLQYSAKAGSQTGRHIYFISSDIGEREIAGLTETK
jgi:hypothetical protein